MKITIVKSFQSWINSLCSNMKGPFGWLALITGFLLNGPLAISGEEPNIGKATFNRVCAQCHAGTVTKAPHKLFLSMMSADAVYKAMDDGLMQVQAAGLSDEEKRIVAEELTGKKLGEEQDYIAENMCDATRSAFDLNEPPAVIGWGVGRNNQRNISSEIAQLPPEKVSQLKLKWAFGFSGATRVRSQPMAAMGALFFGSQDGTVYSLDRETGCIRWTFQASAEVRTPLLMASWNKSNPPKEAPITYFADHIARIHAVNALTGELQWSVKVDDHPSATITGTPSLHRGRLYVPISSIEIANTADPHYACCTFRGSLVALDATTGKQIWRGYTISEEPKEVGKTKAGTAIYAPSGAAIWTSPTVDPGRGLIYVGTGQNYSSPSNNTSDSVLAFRMKDGELAWSTQMMEGDAWNFACMLPDSRNCPEEKGPDNDIGATIVKVKLPSGQDILLAGKKSGEVYAVNPDNGKIIWEKQVGRGGTQGGVHFGMAYQDGKLFVPVSDMNNKESETYAWDIPSKGGIYALDVETGEMLWEHPAPNLCEEGQTFCEPGISAAITVIPGVVFAGHMDGWLRAYSTEDGKLLWEVKTDEQTFPTVNGVEASGGSFGGNAGPMVYDGVVYAGSGYGVYWHRPGNVLLAFEADRK